MAQNVEKEHVLFRNCEKETSTPTQGIISGEIPKWLEGSLYRNGPGIQKIGPYRFNHLFDGLSTIHRFTIKNGKVEYQSRFLESDAFKQNMSNQRIMVNEYGTMGMKDPCEGLFSRFKSQFTKKFEDGITDNCLINVAYYGDQLYAMSETSFVRRIDPDNLKTFDEKTCITDYVAANTATAHPHELRDGSVLNMGSNYRHKKGPHYCIIKIPPTYGSEETSYKGAKIIAEIPVRWKLYPSYYHSFGLSENYALFVEQPLCINVLKNMLFPNSLHKRLQWYPNEKTRIYVSALENGELNPIIYEVDKLFTFHHVNAYEEDGFIIMDVAGYNDSQILNGLEVQNVNLKGNWYEGATVRRFVLPLSIPKGANVGENLAASVKDTKASAILKQGGVIECIPQHLTNDWFEFPRINYSYNGKKYNFFYGCSSTETSEGGFITNIIKKVDIKNGTEIEWKKEGTIASEPIFVQNPEIQEPREDDGVIVSVLLYEGDEKKVSLLILDAKDMSQISLVDFVAEGSVTSTFHGIFATKKQVK